MIETSVVVDTGAGASVIRPEALPDGWDAAMTPHLPGAGLRLRDANGNQLVTSGTISLFFRAGVLPKCRFFRTTVEYLGQEITPGRLGVLQAHTKALREAAFPTTRTQVRSFIGMCNVFRRFVPNFARIATPLTDLMGSTARSRCRHRRRSSCSPSRS